MKKLLFIASISCLLQAFCVVAAFAQPAPLTQAEYVKMLYALQKDPASKSEVIDALRKRGIAFEVTDGIRSLTRSKGANDEDLKRALEEAGRRKQDPIGSQLPSAKEAAALVETARKNTLEAVDEMPDFVVKQQIQRFAAYAGTNNFRTLDRVVVAVSYKASGEETYRVLSVDGILKNEPESKGSYEQVGGTSSTGEFVTMLATIFKPASQTRFELIDTDMIRDRKALVFDFTVDRDKAQQVITSVDVTSVSTVTGIHGKIWIDRENARVLKIDSEATEIPATFPIRTAKRTIDYDWVKIGDEKFLLPSVSDVRLTSAERKIVFETRNFIRFKDYQKYGTEVKILDDDIKPEPAPKPDKP